MDDGKAPHDPSPSIPTRYTGTAGERPEGLPVDLGDITEATIDFFRKGVDDEVISGCIMFLMFNYVYLVDA